VEPQASAPENGAGGARARSSSLWLMFALGTAYRLQCEHADMGKEPIGLAALAAPDPGNRLETTSSSLPRVAMGIFHMRNTRCCLG